MKLSGGIEMVMVMVIITRAMRVIHAPLNSETQLRWTFTDVSTMAMAMPIISNRNH